MSNKDIKMSDRDIIARFKKLYPKEYELFSTAGSETRVLLLQERFISERKQLLKSYLAESGLNIDEKMASISFRVTMKLLRLLYMKNCIIS